MRSRRLLLAALGVLAVSAGLIVCTASACSFERARDAQVAADPAAGTGSPTCSVRDLSSREVVDKCQRATDAARN